MGWFAKSEREKWASPLTLSHPQTHMGLPALDERSRSLYGEVLPRGVLLPRFVPDRPPINYWMRPQELTRYRYMPGQIILGKFAGSFIGHLDDRPLDHDRRGARRQDLNRSGAKSLSLSGLDPGTRSQRRIGPHRAAAPGTGS